MLNNVESIVVARATCKGLLLRLLARIPDDQRIIRDCQGHLEEMRNDPCYVPQDITAAKMIERSRK